METGTPKNAAKKLTFMSIYLLGLNGIIGSGAFLLPSKLHQEVGTSSVFLIIFAGLTASIIALCYADLSGKFSGSGGAWLYAYHSFGRFSATEVGLFVWINGIVTMAAETAAFFTTLQSFFPIFKDTLVYQISAISVILLLGIINLFGTKIVSFFNNLSSGFKIATMLLFIIIGIFFIKTTNFVPLVPKNITEGGVLSHYDDAFSVVFYMFTGFSFLPIVAGKMKNPEKNVPKAIIYVMISCILFYTLLQVTAIGISGDKLAQYPYPIAQAFKDAVGGWGYLVILVGTLVAVLGVAISTSFEASTLAASLAEEKHLLPQALAKKNRFDAPVIAIIVTVLLSSLLILSGDFIFLVSCIVFAAFFQYLFTISATIKYKYLTRKAKKNGQELSDIDQNVSKEKGFVLPGGYLFPILALVVSMYILVNFDIKVILFGGIVFALGVLVYFLNQHLNKRHGIKIE